MAYWNLRDFFYGDIPCQIIEFSVGEHEYMMFFSQVNAVRTPEMNINKAQELGIEFREKSYEVKFDLKANFNSETFFHPPESKVSVAAMKILGKTVVALLDFHYRNSDSEAYLCVASSVKLKRFYDRLAKMYATELKFNIVNGLGEEGLGYEIKTPSYKSSTG